ncbi:MAG: hypothetical protein K0U38_11705 [Epsilonproteobacteria bacterium]|nr:hypothetical protein [Campylobacterota bacterium]
MNAIFLTLLILTISAVGATPSEYDDDVIIPNVLRTDIIQPADTYEEVSLEGNHTEETVINETAISYSENIDDSDIIIPKALQKNQNYQEPSIKEVTPVVETTDSITQTYITQNYTVPNIEGIYTLNEGVERNIQVNNATLVIERLDDDDFGYYYITQLRSHSPTGYYGILHFDAEKNRFLNKTFESSTSTKLNDNIELTYDGKQLQTVLDISVGKRAIIWDKQQDNNTLQPTKVLQLALDEAKNSYIQIYKNNPSFLQ